MHVHYYKKWEKSRIHRTEALKELFNFRSKDSPGLTWLGIYICSIGKGLAVPERILYDYHLFPWLQHRNQVPEIENFRSDSYV